MNIQIPAGLAPGSSVQVVVTIGGKQSNPVTIVIGS
ncbi:MAG: hypothetical protein HYU39_06915 [Thaumarchaeota archaeon]|nr:hypothetical protein [Nitrososphaerota archaeon]